MADTAAHPVDHVLPRTPVRQWVLTLPWRLRYRLGYDSQLAARAEPSSAGATVRGWATTAVPLDEQRRQSR